MKVKSETYVNNVKTMMLEMFKSSEEKGDITLACEDGVKIKANKCVLRAFSETFKNILDEDIPLIYMRGTKSKDMKKILEFIYYGETQINHEDVDSFVDLAAELKIKGMNIIDKPYDIRRFSYSCDRYVEDVWDDFEYIQALSKDVTNTDVEDINDMNKTKTIHDNETIEDDSLYCKALSKLLTTEVDEVSRSTEGKEELIVSSRFQDSLRQQNQELMQDDFDISYSIALSQYLS